MKKGSLNKAGPLPTNPTVAERLADEIRKRIFSDYRVGERIPTTREIAHQFGCSINSAHHALGILRREGLIEGRSGRGTHVTQSSSDQHVALIVGLSEEYPALGSYAGRLLASTIRCLQRGGIGVRTYWDFDGLECLSPAARNGDNLESLWSNIASNQVSAIGVIQKLRGGKKNLRLTEGAAPVVWNTKMTGGYWVANDFEGLLREGVSSLVEQGAKKIAVLTWDEGGKIAQGVHPWSAILKQLFSEYGLDLREDWMRGTLDPSEPGAGYEEFREIWGAAEEKPDGIFVTDDVLLPDVALAIHELGIKVPENLSVVAAANRGIVTSPRFPATRIVADPLLSAEALGGILTSLSKGEEPAEPRIIIPFDKLAFSDPKMAAATPSASKKASARKSKASKHLQLTD